MARRNERKKPSKSATRRAGQRPGKKAPSLRAAIAQGRAQAHEVVRQRARRGLEEGPAGQNGLLIAEGDSWFDYPFYDVLEELEDRFGYRVESVAHKGDTVEGMAYDVGQLSKLAARFERLGRRGEMPRAIVLSGGGNDVAGDEFVVFLNHRISGLPPLNEGVVAGILEERLRFAVVSLISAVTELSRTYFQRVAPVLVHGYDYPVPDGRGYLGGFWVLPGPWLEPGFRRKGYADLPERCRIIADLMDRFNTMLRRLPAQPGLAHVKYVDLRGTLSSELAHNRYRKSWENELHPTRAGFEQVAQKFHDAIRTLPMP